MWLSEKGKGNLERYFFLGIAFLLVFIPAAIRYDVGTDYLNYLAIYEDSMLLDKYKSAEPSFYFVNWFYKSIDAHFQWMFATFAFIFTMVAFRSYPRKQAWLLHFLIFSMLWFFSFNGMRQAIAVMWSLLALFYFFDRKYIWFFVLTLFGATFHQSVLFVALVGLVALFPLERRIKTRIAPLFFIGFIVFTLISMNVVLAYMEQIIGLVGSKYVSYFDSSKHFAERDYGSGLGVLAKILFSIYIIWHAKNFIEVNERYWLLIVVVFFYAVGTVLGNDIIIFGRMGQTFVMGPVVAAFVLLQLPNNRVINRLVLGFFLIFLAFTYVKDSFGEPTTYGDPKRVPYQTVFQL